MDFAFVLETVQRSVLPDRAKPGQKAAFCVVVAADLAECLFEGPRTDVIDIILVETWK